jgi:RNA polymerase primary sigma factor
MSDKRPTAGEQSTMGLYLRELRRIPPLGREEEQALAALAALGDRKARERLIRANLRFVIMVAKRYCKCGVPLEDLVNEGNIGLIHAAERFDPDRGVRFVSYAVWWIRQAIMKALRGTQGTLSLDSPLTDGENPDPFGACLEDRNVPKPEEVLVGISRREHVDSVLAGLSDREACILRGRFGLAGSKPITLREVGRMHGLSKERVRQIEKKALRRIRASQCVQNLEVYAN